MEAFIFLLSGATAASDYRQEKKPDHFREVEQDLMTRSLAPRLVTLDRQRTSFLFIARVPGRCAARDVCRLPEYDARPSTYVADFVFRKCVVVGK